ncbi:MAG: hypothetical protein ACYTGH_06640, partial [Planctomycetota bacterium]
MRLIRQFGYNHSRLTRYLRALLWYGRDSVMSSREIDDHTAEKFHYGRQACIVVREGNEYRAYENYYEGKGGGGELAYDPERKELKSVVDGTCFAIADGRNLGGGGNLTPVMLEALPRDDYVEFYVLQDRWTALTNWDNWHGVFLLKFGR